MIIIIIMIIIISSSSSRKVNESIRVHDSCLSNGCYWLLWLSVKALMLFVA
jgi:hypothetical protein